jgi:hypothetical protein
MINAMTAPLRNLRSGAFLVNQTFQLQTGFPFWMTHFFAAGGDGAGRATA